MAFDVTGLEEYSGFGSIIEPMSADDLRAAAQKGNTM